MIPPIRNIVLGFDFSLGARAALAAVCPLLRQTGAHLHVVTAAPGAVDADVVEAVEQARTAPLEADFLHRLEEYVRVEVARALRGRAETTFRTTLRPAAQSILAVAGSVAADLILVGDVGNRPSEGASRVGVDVQRLTRLSPAPVLVLRPDQPFPPRRALCAVDFSEASAQALDLLALLARLDDASIEVVHCLWERPAAEKAAIPVDSQEHGRALRVVADRSMMDFLAHARLGGLVPRVALLDGPPDQTVLQRVVEGEFDLLALGTIGRTEIARLTIGSTAERIIRSAECNLLAVRPRRFDDAGAFWGRTPTGAGPGPGTPNPIGRP